VIRLLVDHNFDEHIVTGTTQRDPAVDLVLARTVGLAAAPDPALLEWAATHDRVLLTHDRKTIPRYAYARVVAGEPMVGVFLVRDDMPTGQAIDEILIAVHCLSPPDCKDSITYFPM
jgi:predicted nuclease of predicted toxin-antitoxin system